MTETLWSCCFGELVCAHKRDAVPSPVTDMHTHDYVELYYFLSGNCAYLIEGTVYSLKPHDLVVKRPWETHKLIVNSIDVPYERIVISLPTDQFRSLDPDNRLLDGMMNRSLGTGNRFTATDFGHGLCTELLTHMAQNGPHLTAAQMQGILLFLLAEIDRVTQGRAQTESMPDVGKRLIEYVNDRLFTDLSLEDVSAAFFISRSQVNRLFRAHTGSPLGRYVTAKRLLYARERIRSGMTAVEACFACGYTDYSAFYRAYVKRFGHSPQADKKATMP